MQLVVRREEKKENGRQTEETASEVPTSKCGFLHFVLDGNAATSSLISVRNRRNRVESIEFDLLFRLRRKFIRLFVAKRSAHALRSSERRIRSDREDDLLHHSTDQSRTAAEEKLRLYIRELLETLL